MRCFLLLFMLIGTIDVLAEPPAADPNPPKDPDARKSVLQEAEPAQDNVIKMGVESGRLDDKGRDNRVFTVPIACGDAKTNFTWGCGGQTIISAWFAQKARIEIHPNEDLKVIVDGEGKPLFLGDASVELTLGGKKFAITAWIMRDGTFNKNVPGVIGYEVAKKFQWEIDPRVPQMTIRELGTAPKGKVLATLPLKEDQDNLWIHIKVRNVEDDVTLMPQTPDFQAAPALQKSWDIDRNGQQPDDIKTYLGNMRVMTLRGQDGIHFTPEIFETNFLAYLLGEDPNARNAIGQSLLNRFVYSVDVSKKEMLLISRVSHAAAKPAVAPAAR
jgi:hypothetical protein